MNNGIGPTCIGLLLFLAVGVGLTGKPMRPTMCPDGSPPDGGYCYSFEHSYEPTYYETLPADKSKEETK